MSSYVYIDTYTDIYIYIYNIYKRYIYQDTGWCKDACKRPHCIIDIQF